MLRVTVVPDTAPEKEARLGELAVTVIVKLPATNVPPLSLITFLMTTRRGALSLLVTVHVLVWPSAIVLLQSAE